MVVDTGIESQESVIATSEVSSEGGGVKVEKVRLPEGVKELVESQSRQAGASGQNDGKQKGKKTGMKSSLPQGAEYVVIDGKQFTKQMLASEIKSEIEKRIGILKKKLRKSESLFGRFDAMDYQQNFGKFRQLYDFLQNFFYNFKRMAILKLKSLYEIVVVQKGDPVL